MTLCSRPRQYQEKWDKWKQEESDPSKQPTIEPKLAALAERGFGQDSGHLQRLSRG